MKIKDIIAIASVALMTVGCNSVDEAQQEGRVPILLRAVVEGTATGQTRTPAATTATTQDTEFLPGELVDAYVFLSDGSTPLATGTDPGTNPLKLNATGTTGDLTPVSSTEPKYYYPTDGSPVNIYAVHPSVGSGDPFSVETDQTTDDNYAKSDLCYNATDTYTRQTGSQTLLFNHVLSKIVVRITTNISGATLPTAVKLMACKTTAITYPTGTAPDYTLDAASDPATITMAMTTASGTATGAAVIPPQTIAAGASFLAFSVPGVGPMVYPMPAATTFESGKRYTYDIRVDNVGITATTNVTDWGEKVANQQVMGKKYRPILPIEYAAQTNMYDATTFAANNKKNTSCFMNWTTAYGYYNSTNGTQRNLTSQSCIGKTYSSWHLPTFAEVSTVVPSPNLTTGNPYVYFNATSLLYSGETLEWGWNGSSYNVSGTFYSEYKNISQKYAYAVRYKDNNTAKGGYGRYTTAFRYELRNNFPESGDESLIIRWKWLGDNNTDILSDGSDDIIGKESYWSTYDGECIIPRVGFYTSGNANAGTTPSGANAHYWTSTSKNETMKYLYYYNDGYIGDSGTTYLSTRDKGYGFTVRLFADVEL